MPAVTSKTLDPKILPVMGRKARVQQPAPNFKGTAVVDGAFEEIALEDYTHTGQWVLLNFVPMAWTFVCPTEIIAFSDRLEAFTERKTAVVFASTDSEYSLLAWSNTERRDGGLGSIGVPLLSDKNHRLSREYGVLIEDEGIALRGQFLIDPHGILRQATINDVQVGRNVDEALRLIDAFKFADEYGEVCPVNWNPGTDTINATPEGHKDYLDRKYSDETEGDPLSPVMFRASIAGLPYKGPGESTLRADMKDILAVKQMNLTGGRQTPQWKIPPGFH